MRYLPLLLLILAACKKSDEQHMREMTLCIGASTDERRGVTDPSAFGQCLWLRYEWSQDEVQDAQLQLAAAVRSERIRQDSLRRAARR